MVDSLIGTLTGTTNLGQSGPGSNGKDGVYHILENSRTEASLSDAVYCHTHLLDGWGSYPSTEGQSVYFTALPNRAVCSLEFQISSCYFWESWSGWLIWKYSQSRPGSNGNEGALCTPQSPSITGNLTTRLFSVTYRTLIGGVLPLYRGAVSVFYSPSRLGK